MQEREKNVKDPHSSLGFMPVNAFFVNITVIT